MPPARFERTAPGLTILCALSSVQTKTVFLPGVHWVGKAEATQLTSLAKRSSRNPRANGLKERELSLVPLEKQQII